MAVTGDPPRTASGASSALPQQRGAPPEPSSGGAVPQKHAGPREIALDFLERAGWTAGQVFFATLLAGGRLVTASNLPWKYASVLALSAGVASVALTTLQYLGQWLAGREITSFWLDIVIRLAKTFLASLAGSFAAAHPFDITTFHWATALNLAAVAVLTALGKGLLARTGDTGSAAAATGTADVRTPSTLPTVDYLGVQQRLATAKSGSAG